MGAPLDWPSELKCGLARAAQQDLLKSTTDRTAAILLDQMQGALRCALEALLNELNQGGLAAAERRIGELLERSVLGLHLVHPWQIVLAGPPNVGKSSLMNALVGTRQAIVHHEPGTTRDWLEAGGAIDGWPVIFTDTAGIRSTQDPIEQAGVQRSRQRLQMADLAVLVVDAQHGWTDEHEQLSKLIRVPPLVAWNKVDVACPTAPPTVRYEDSELDCILTSALGEPGTADLLSAISRRLLPMSPAVGAAVPFRAEQVERLVDCQRLVQTQKCAEARQLVLQWLSENNY
jgi:tRNA modification GTPase